VTVPVIGQTGVIGAAAVAALGLGVVVGCAVVDVKKPAPLMTEGSMSPQPWTRYPDWPKARWDTFNTLVTTATPTSGPVRRLAGAIAGDPDNGRRLAFDTRRGVSCLVCHVMGPAGQDQPGNFGPDLSEIGNAGRSDEYLFNVVYDARVYNPETLMPPWGAHGVFTESEIRDIVAFLKTLKAPAAFPSAFHDPNRRPRPVEERDNLDPFVNPAMNALDQGKELFARHGPTGAACATCHANLEETFKTWAAGMPKYEPRLNKVLGVEEFVARHAAATTGDAFLMQSPENLALAIYLRSFANGQPIRIDTASEDAIAAYERGKALSARKIGQLNFACVDCHAKERGANKWLRGQYLTERRGQTPHFPAWRITRNEIWDIRKRFQWCNVAIRANELPPDHPAYGDLELYVTSFSNGLPLNVPGIGY
jgi:sulfur-oxidizing protein SoxA